MKCCSKLLHQEDKVTSLLLEIHWKSDKVSFVVESELLLSQQLAGPPVKERLVTYTMTSFDYYYYYNIRQNLTRRKSVTVRYESQTFAEVSPHWQQRIVFEATDAAWTPSQRVEKNVNGDKRSTDDEALYWRSIFYQQWTSTIQQKSQTAVIRSSLLELGGFFQTMHLSYSSLADCYAHAI